MLFCSSRRRLVAMDCVSFSLVSYLQITRRVTQAEQLGRSLGHYSWQGSMSSRHRRRYTLERGSLPWFFAFDKPYKQWPRAVFFLHWKEWDWGVGLAGHCQDLTEALEGLAEALAAGKLNLGSSNPLRVLFALSSPEGAVLVTATTPSCRIV